MSQTSGAHLPLFVLPGAIPEPVQGGDAQGYWNMNSVSLLNWASNWWAGIGRPNR
ncbi:hypothetical protein AB7M23_001867 [Pseudomonas sp. HLS-6 TE3448]